MERADRVASQRSEDVQRQRTAQVHEADRGRGMGRRNAGGNLADDRVGHRQKNNAVGRRLERATRRHQPGVKRSSQAAAEVAPPSDDETIWRF